jgi:hypothetical protein
MRNFLLGKAAFPVQIIALLLLLQPVAITSSPPACHSGEKASHRPCGCSVADAASGACGCAARQCCSCCAAPQKKPPPACHRNAKGFSTSFIRVSPCGDREVFTGNASGSEFILADSPAAFALTSTLFSLHPRQKPENRSLQPSVPPPEIAPLISAPLS